MIESITSSTTEFTGSCHCGGVRFSCKLESPLLDQETLKCNCSYCFKSRFWEIRVKTENFKLLTKEGDASTYKWGSKINDNIFCRFCGINTHTFVKMEEVPDAPYYVISVPTIEGLTQEQFSNLKVTYLDGLHESWWTEPKFKNHL